MPRMMQQIIVSSRPIMVASPAICTMALIRMEARPVTVMQPAIIPAMAQATATVMAPLAPASSASTILPKVSRSSLFRKPTTMAARMDTAAENCMVRLPEETRKISRARGMMR